MVACSPKIIQSHSEICPNKRSTFGSCVDRHSRKKKWCVITKKIYKKLQLKEVYLQTFNVGYEKIGQVLRMAIVCSSGTVVSCQQQKDASTARGVRVSPWATLDGEQRTVDSCWHRTEGNNTHLARNTGPYRESFPCPQESIAGNSGQLRATSSLCARPGARPVRAMAGHRRQNHTCPVFY